MRQRIALLVLLGRIAAAQDPLATPGFEHFYNLEYNEALSAFRAEAAKDPDSPAAHNHIAQTILYRDMFRSGALESELVTGSNPFLRRERLNPGKADVQEFQDAISHAQSLAEALLRTTPNDAQALYAQGVSYGLQANYHFLVQKAYVEALHEATAARKAHVRVTELDPNFTDALLVQGVYDYVVGSLPRAWKMLGFFAGFRGDRERGIETVKKVAAGGRLNRVDAEILLCAAYRRERRPQQAVPLLTDLVRRFPRNYLLRLELVQMYGDAGEKERALAVIGEIEQLKRSGAPGYQRLSDEKLRFTRGNLLFWYDDLDLALEHLAAVTANFEAVDLNTATYAWLRTGQIHDLLKRRQEALSAYQHVVAMAPDSDASRLARRYSSARYKR